MMEGARESATLAFCEAMTAEKACRDRSEYSSDESLGLELGTLRRWVKYVWMDLQWGAQMGRALAKSFGPSMREGTTSYACLWSKGANFIGIYC